MSVALNVCGKRLLSGKGAGVTVANTVDTVNFAQSLGDSERPSHITKYVSRGLSGRASLIIKQTDGCRHPERLNYRNVRNAVFHVYFVIRAYRPQWRD